MTAIPLLGGAYQSRSVIADAQRCVNLYPEVNESPDAAVKVMHYQTPGLVQKIATGGQVVRGLYTAKNGKLYAVVDANVYYIDSSWNKTLLGTIKTGRSNPVSMVDNGLCMMIVDGSTYGWAVDIDTNAFSRVSGNNFYGADIVRYVDTYFVLNRHGTSQFYITLSNVTYAMLVDGSAIDPLDIASKTGRSDNIVSFYVLKRELWLLGDWSSEVYQNTGASDFTYGAVQGSFIEHGCAAPYSVQSYDSQLFWLSKNDKGSGIVFQGAGYAVTRISTFAIENKIQQYSTISDAIGMVYQAGGHVFYVLTFPTADATWVYDMATKQWHERAYLSDGDLTRHRANCMTYAYGLNLVGDYENGKIYAFDNKTFTDDGMQITRIRTMPHLLGDDMARVHYRALVLNISTGDVSGVSLFAPMKVTLRYSDDRGKSWSGAVTQDLSSTGDYLNVTQFTRLGMARDRVFEISWSGEGDFALAGAWVDAIKAAS